MQRNAAALTKKPKAALVSYEAETSFAAKLPWCLSCDWYPSAQLLQIVLVKEPALTWLQPH